ncbi:1,2-dihydroxy-3-keto-5-methylthiopentene dioxygenase 4-like isoform X2 [Panicum virgatum]|uniref:1,2-dihydroxy-3-keto-5-methylthiopentene dioxygenase 4-like isoform X2 n=1 Tax=Panicum virgatum TaxID=38727 RepID=UPI0019D5A270|nr:1,2-dihydroxy-3-keto-5-methylthiopentene dioxygenase 4-like isoform X2 [Panicum virgatum]
MAPQAWIVGEKGEDLQGPKESLPLSKLEDIGVLYWQLDPKKSESEEELAKIRKERGYSYMDLIEICPDKLENYEEKLKNFFTEHMHADEEIRYCLEGSGYFDVRDRDDKWIRIWIKLMRLFIGEPVWTALNRPQEGHPSRQEYVKNVMGNNGFALAAH